jgi:hypothetical protein
MCQSYSVYAFNMHLCHDQTVMCPQSTDMTVCQENYKNYFDYETGLSTFWKWTILYKLYVYLENLESLHPPPLPKKKIMYTEPPFSQSLHPYMFGEAEKTQDKTRSE